LPVGVLIGKAFVIVDEGVHRLGKRENLGLALGIDPAAEEALSEDTELRPRIPAQVDDLVGGLATGDDRASLAIQIHEHGALLDPAGAPGGEHGTMVLAHELARGLQVHPQSLRSWTSR